MKTIEKITRVSITEVWKHEAKNLTPWLCENIDVISDIIGVQLTNPEKEQSTGNFNVDIKAEDIEGNVVVIENQFGASNHDHLGKLLTYLTSFNAKTAIWIVETPKQEHINVINWLNEAENNCDFYILKLEAIKIGNSNPAPLLSKVAGPNEESKKIGKIKKEDSERHKLRLAFWIQLLEVAKEKKLTPFNAISPTKDSWIAASAGIRGLAYTMWVNQFSVRIELRIDRGKGAEEENLSIFNSIQQHKAEIEEIFGSSLIWADLEGFRVCSIRKDYDKGGYRSEESLWDSIIGQVVDGMIKLESAIKPHLKDLKLK
jgi:hypothetical protein